MSKNLQTEVFSFPMLSGDKNLTNTDFYIIHKDYTKFDRSVKDYWGTYSIDDTKFIKVKFISLTEKEELTPNNETYLTNNTKYSIVVDTIFTYGINKVKERLKFDQGEYFFKGYRKFPNPSGGKTRRKQKNKLYKKSKISRRKTKRRR